MMQNNPINNIVLELSQDLDLAFDEKNIDKIKSIIKTCKSLENTVDDISKIQLFYSIGTAYGSISELNIDSDFDIKSKYIMLQIYYFRKAISTSKIIDRYTDINVFINPLLCSLYTNYANILDDCGRKQLAIQMYNESIRINPKFSMASGNLAISLERYRYYLNENEHFYFCKEIKRLVENSISFSDPNRIDFAEDIFLELYNRYSHYDLAGKCTCKNIVTNNDSQDYQEWCLKNILFLNPLNDLQEMDLSILDDNLLLPSLLEKSDIRLKKILSMFNQIKQEYVYARFLCYSSKKLNKVHLADENVSLVNCFDYTQYSFRIEGLKTAFKTLYSLLDKVAMFINEYYILDSNPRRVNFHSIWNSFNSLDIILTKNIGLSSIYWITKDFDNEDNSLTANPDSKRLKNIRNYLEHRFANITLDFFGNSTNNESSRLYISENELRDYTLDLLHLIREVIFSLKNAVQISENEKKDSIDTDIITLPVRLKEIASEDKK